MAKSSDKINQMGMQIVKKAV
ncbi:hypothetical protein ENHYD8BJ_130037 [Enhydrobacter sp. 8BJ]|nr:hypothetical protein ENHYD8BJ_130037 [Enhydrobacter sp. 8BJ]